MTVEFCDYFWGEKNAGFDVLYQNAKYGQLACKELADFFKERAVLEENYSKTLVKLANRANNAGSAGTFSPLWIVLRMATERMASVHTAVVARISDLVKEVQKYLEDLHKRQKSLKEEEGPTMEVVQCIQQLTISTVKAKEIYTLRANELRKAQEANMPPRDVEKAENKFKKSAEEYRHLVEKYGNVRGEFERKMVISCRHFQETEENYLCQMKEFIEGYVKICEDSHLQSGEVYSELRDKCEEKPIIKLLEEFALNKHTGLEKPVCMEFEEIVVPVMSANNEIGGADSAGDVIGTLPDSVQAHPSSTVSVPRQGFLRGRRSKLTKQSKKKESDKESKSDGEESKNSPEVDEEGYSIRPQTVPVKSTRNYESSDSDSDSDTMSRFHVKINPLSNGAPISASVDELRHMASGLTLSSCTMNKSPSPYFEENNLRRSQSVSQQLGKNRTANDLAGLSLPSPTHSVGSGQSASVSEVKPKSCETSTSSDRYSALGDLFNESSDVQPSLPPKLPAKTISHGAASSAGSSIVIPRPPSRRSNEGTLRGRASPHHAASAPRSVSASPVTPGLARKPDPTPVGYSRGPSPLTLSLSDTVPLAVAFQEVVHAYFRGSDHSRCQVKLSGDLIVSFPSGIVQLLAKNPTPSPLVFSVKFMRKLDGLLPNRHLIVASGENKGVDEPYVFEFRMANLSKLLKMQTERNPTASYFNVDIIKYQVNAIAGSASAPVHLTSYWKCEPSHTDLKIEYSLNERALISSASCLQNLVVAVPVDGKVMAMHSKPIGKWVPETSRAIWTVGEPLSSAGGTLKARFELEHGRGSPSTIAAQFCCEGATLSGAQFQLIGSGYRLSLVKRRFVAGKYLCDSDFIESGERYAAPPLAH